MATKTPRPKGGARGPSKKAKPKAPRKARASAKAPAKARKPRKPRAKKPAAKRRSGPSVTSPVRAPKRSLKRLLLVESAVVVAGLAVGTVGAGFFLWERAERDVEAYIANPPVAHPGVVYSAPMLVSKGMQVQVQHLAGDLLAAGYERVEQLHSPGEFTLTDGSFSIWTGAMVGPGFDLPEGKSSVQIRGERVVSTSPASKVILRPTVLAVVGDLENRRTEVQLDHISPWVERSVLAMEDTRFRDHRGIDPFGLARAVYHNVLGRGGMHGGSTLTQQLAKNLFLSQERTLRRKVREAFFASALESELSKDELLELYLGEVYLGQMGGVPIHGVEQAARAWFGVSASRLSAGQAALIGGVISAPNAYSPVRHPERAKERRDITLTRMETLGWLPADEADAARAQDLVIGGELPGLVRRAPWAVDMAIEAAEEAVGDGGIAGHGYRIHTTIQPQLQRIAEQAIRGGTAELDREYPKAAGAQAALVSVDVHTGAVVALVGGRDYRSSPFNRAAQAWRQAGSTIKPLTLIAAFDADPELTAITLVTDEPIVRVVDGTTWTPRNYDGTYLGPITVRRAIEGSRNVPAVKLAEKVGAQELQSHLRTAGLSRATHLPSASLGAFEATPLQLAGAYTVFPGGGAVQSPHVLVGVVDRSGEMVIDYAPQATALASGRAAAMATSVLEGVMSDGTGARSARYGVTGPVGGKTGTTDDYRDAWFVGFTPSLSTAVWVGRDRGGGVGLSGSRAALPTWSRYTVASGALGGRFPSPDGMVHEPVCLDTHMLARKACPRTYDEVFAQGGVPKGKCDEHGGPLVEIGRAFGDLFGRRKRKSIDGDASQE